MKRHILSLILLISISSSINANLAPCVQQNNVPKCTVRSLCQKFGQTLGAFNIDFDKKTGLCIANVESPVGKGKIGGEKSRSVRVSTFTFESTHSDAAGLVTGQIALEKKDLAKALAILKKDPKVQVARLNKRFKHVSPSDMRYLIVQANKEYIIRFARTVRTVLNALG